MAIILGQCMNMIVEFGEGGFVELYLHWITTHFVSSDTVGYFANCDNLYNELLYRFNL